MKKILFAILLPFLVVADTMLVDNGQANACIVLSAFPEKESDIMAASGEELGHRLAEYIQKSTGAELPIISSDKPASHPVRILLSVNSSDKMDVEGFKISFPEENLITIVGGSLRGLEYGIADFLERFVGVRWLFPGPLGTAIPHHATLSIPHQEISKAPSFLRRFLAGGRASDNSNGATDYYRWMVNNRGDFHRRFYASHNLWHLLSVKKYGESRPDFYPVHKGVRFIPKENENIWWQPCFTAPGIAEAVAKEIGQKGLVSLSVNDGGRHCECPRCLEMDGNDKNYLGLPNRSRSYLAFCNQVARLCPNTKLPFYAYSDVAEPPSNIKLEPNLIPSLTYETFEWLDPARRKFSEELLRRWQSIAPDCHFSWYDYVYGQGYAIPRMFTHALGENLKWLYRNNVRYLDGEYFPNGNWQDALKVYVWLKLAYDINLDIDELIQDWCTSAVGTMAGPALQRYFDVLEKFWSNPALIKTKWFRPATWLNWTDSSYLDTMSEDFPDQLEKCLAEVVQLAETDEYRQRAEYFQKSFQRGKGVLEVALRNRRLKQMADQLHFDQIILQEDFNGVVRGWTTWQEKKGKGNFGFTENQGRNNTPALLTDVNGADKLSLSHLGSRKAEPGKIYRVTVWHRSSHLTPNGVVSISARYQKDGRWMSMAYNSSISYTATEIAEEDWQKTVLLSAAPKEEDISLILVFSVSRANSGQVFFDDVLVETTSDTLPNPK